MHLDLDFYSGNIKQKQIFREMNSLCDTSAKEIIPFSGLKYKSNYLTIQCRLSTWSKWVEKTTA
jgi:hypothetical protein